MKKMKLLPLAVLAATLLLCAAFLGCNKNKNQQVNEKVTNQDSSSLFRIEEGSNFVVYILRRNGNEYILVNGLNGMAIVKHR